MNRFRLRAVALLFLVTGPVFADAPLPAARPQVAQAEETVFFNTKTHKFHCPTCDAALRCTAHCVPVTRSDALRRGGVPCRRCGGTCRR